jgi:hypothetical protein
MIDEFVNDLASRLHLSRRARQRVLDEVRDHLDDAVADLQSQGIDAPAARVRAVRAFGHAGDLARQFNAQAATMTMRRTPLVVGTGAIAVIGGFLLAATTQPHPAVPTTASAVVQVSFFVATLGLQVAVVAGARAASRVAARWGTATAPADDRQLVRRAAMICVGGLVVAALGWTVALTSAVDQRPHVRTLPYVAGDLLMLGGAIGAVISVRRRQVPDADEVQAAQPEAGVVLGLGERLIQVVQQWPWTACVTIAIFAAIAVMSHAETTVTSALPWGAVEAAAVVAGFVVLGPPLRLRTAPPSDDSPMRIS